MLKTLVAFSSILTHKLRVDDTRIPFPRYAEEFLLSSLGTDDYIYLTISDNLNAEVIKVTNTCGYLTVERALDGTKARTFPRGSCISFVMTPLVVKDLICNYDCCDGDCPVEKVSSAGIAFPKATVNNQWVGTVVFSGTLPITIGVNAPDWVTVEVGANFAKLTATPNTVGSFNIAVSATNGAGKYVDVAQGTLVVSK